MLEANGAEPGAGARPEGKGPTMTSTTDRPHPAGVASRRAGYVVAAVVNAVLLVLVNVTPGWSVLPFLTADMAIVLPWINASMIVGIVVNAVFVVADGRRVKGLGDLITEVVGLGAMIVLWQVFPFDFGSDASAWATVVRVALVIGIAGTAVAMIVSVVMVIRGPGVRQDQAAAVSR